MMAHSLELGHKLALLRSHPSMSHTQLIKLEHRAEDKAGPP